MSRKRTSGAARGVMIAVVTSLAIPMLGFAQGGPGFLFKQPTLTVKLETGYGFQMANSDLFDFVVDSFTVDRRDFDGPYFGGEVAYRATERIDVALGVGLVQSSIDADDLRWEDTSTGLPLQQSIRLRVVPVSLSAKYYFSDRGRRVGRFAWVPNRLTPYVGAGVGIVAYEFRMLGDFVDQQTLEIFYSQVSDSGEAGLMRGLAGLSISLGRQFELSTEARYTLSSATLDSGFEGFEPLDLDGFQAVVGVAVRF